MKKLIVHVGHGKTGSSYLQSVFALNTDILNRHGIDYPEHPSMAAARLGHISSGNGPLILEGGAITSDFRTLLFSNEGLFQRLLRDTERLADLSETFDLTVVLYTRDVIEHAISRWSQRVKRGGLSQDLDTFLMTDHNTVRQTLLDWVAAAETLGFRLLIRNYSKCRDTLLADFITHFLDPDVPERDLRHPPHTRVNRGLSFSECEIQRLFNVVIGQSSSHVVSDFCVNAFPDTVPFQPKIKAATFEHLVQENEAAIAKINKYLPPDQKLEIGSREAWVRSEDTQPQMMDHHLCEELGANIKASFLRLSPDDVDTIRDTAIRIYNETRNVEVALALMKVAAKCRPNGTAITRRIEEWTTNTTTEP